MIQGRPGQPGRLFFAPAMRSPVADPVFGHFSANAAKKQKNLWQNREKTVILAVLQILFLAILVVPSGFPLVVH